jgi:GT2 family glycosyltransferase
VRTGSGESYSQEILMSGPDGRIGVVVITHNRCEELLRTVDRLTTLDERPPIVVVDNASQDDSCCRVARAYPQVKTLPQPRNLGAAARTIGVRNLDTPYVALCDDDTWWETGCLRRAADLLDQYPRVGVLNARVLVGPQADEDPTCLSMAESPISAEGDLPGKPLLGFLAGAVIVRRSAFLECGGFESRLFLGGEEQLLAVDLAIRGWQICYVPELVVHHFPSHLRDACDRRRHELRNALWFAWLRRPARAALRRSITLIRAAPRRVALQGIGLALAGLPWVWRNRRVVSPTIEDGLCRLEAWQASHEKHHQQEFHVLPSRHQRRRLATENACADV